MNEQEREELIENLMTALIRARLNGFNYENTARAALAVAEPVIREACAQIAASHNGCEISIREGQWCEAGYEIATAIREGGNKDE